MRRASSYVSIAFAAFAALFLAMPALAQSDEAMNSARKQLKAIYDQRTDLQAAFQRSDWEAATPKVAKDLKDLEGWARRYGFEEYPSELAWYAPGSGNEIADLVPPPKALRPISTAFAPMLKANVAFDFSKLSASAVMVVDVSSREVLLARNSRALHPAASITKLMTAMVALDRRVSMTRTVTLTKDDEVGGARLRVASGTRLSVRDLFYAMLIGSANNAANALMRTAGPSPKTFVAAMNAKAKTLGLAHTVFVDPAGIEVSNVSTAEDLAALGLEAFGVYDIKKATTTGQHTILAARVVHSFKNTNTLLTDVNNGLYVQGGKTGYLPEAGWNLAVKMMDSRHKPVMVVVLGSDTMDSSFHDAQTAARWVWDNYRWTVK